MYPCEENHWGPPSRRAPMILNQSFYNKKLLTYNMYESKTIFVCLITDAKVRSMCFASKYFQRKARIIQ